MGFQVLAYARDGNFNRRFEQCVLGFIFGLVLVQGSFTTLWRVYYYTFDVQIACLLEEAFGVKILEIEMQRMGI
jgi:hypothetical protein